MWEMIEVCGSAQRVAVASHERQRRWSEAIGAGRLLGGHRFIFGKANRGQAYLYKEEHIAVIN